MPRFTDRYSLEIDTKGAKNALSGLKSAIVAIGAAIVTKEIIDVTARFEDLQTSLNTVTKSAEAGARAFEFIQNFATQTQFGVEDLTKTFIQLKAAGIEPTENLLRTFADTAAVTTDQLGSLEAITALLSRTTGGGLGLEELERLADRGIPVYRILREEIGLTRDQISEFGQTAEGANTIVQALLTGLDREFGGATEARLNNLSTVISNFRIAIANLAFEFGSGISPAIKEITTSITQFVEANKGIARVIGEGIGTALLTVRDLIAEVLEQIGLLSPGGIQEFAAGITDALASFISGFARSVDSIVSTLKSTLVALQKAVVALSEIPGIGFDAIFLQAGQSRDTFVSDTQRRIDELKEYLDNIPFMGWNEEAYRARQELQTLENQLEAFRNNTLIVFEEMETGFSSTTDALDPFVQSLRETADELRNDAEAARLAATEYGNYEDHIQRIANAQRRAAEASEAARREQELLNDLVRQEQNRQNEVLDSYRSSTEELLKQYRHRTNLLGLSEEEAELAEQKFALETQLAQVLLPLQERLLELQQQNTAASQAQIAVVQESISAIRQQYAETLAAVEEAVKARQAELQIQREQQSIEAARVAAAEAVADAQERIRQAQEDAELADLSGLARQLREIEIQERRIARAAKERVTAQLEEGINASVVAGELAKIEAVTRESIQRQQEIVRSQYEQQRTFAYGWRTAFEEYVENATNAADTARNVFERSVKGMEDAIVGFAKTGKFEFKSFIASVLEDLLRAQVRQALANVFSLPQLNVGGTSGGGGLFGGFFATGGMIPPGRFGIVGENGPEIVSGPANVTPAMNTSVTYNINAVDALSFKQLVAQDPGFIHAVAMKGGSAVPSGR